MASYRIATKKGAVARSGADLGSEKLGEIASGTVVVALEETTNAAGVARVRTQDGWISRKVLEAVAAVEPARTSDAAIMPKETTTAKGPAPRVDVNDGIKAAEDATWVPWPARIRGAPVVAHAAVMRWLHRKLALKQDAFLLGDPGPHLRQTVFQFCAGLGLEATYVAVTRDTTEADLKQRREVCDGNVE